MTEPEIVEVVLYQAICSGPCGLLTNDWASPLCHFKSDAKRLAKHHVETEHVISHEGAS